MGKEKLVSTNSTVEKNSKYFSNGMTRSITGGNKQCSCSLFEFSHSKKKKKEKHNKSISGTTIYRHQNKYIEKHSFLPKNSSADRSDKSIIKVCV